VPGEHFAQQIEYEAQTARHRSVAKSIKLAAQQGRAAP
jgi:hypothetical protein